MTKVSIIEIDLGTDIDALIAENVKELTGAAKKELDNAIEIAQQRDALREKKATERQQATDAVTSVMLTARDELIKAGSEGILCDDVIAIVSDHVPNSSAFTLRMKKILREEGNTYALSRKKHKGKQRYVFTPFNKENP